jgi:elongation factor Ts
MRRPSPGRRPNSGRGAMPAPDTEAQHSGANMAEITASMVKELREKTDAPMMECKKALTEAAGDMEKAEEILRVKLGNKAAKASARVAAEGIVGTFLSPDGKLAAIIEVNCETDFVAKNEDFLAFTRELAALVANGNPADVAALSAMPLSGKTVDQVRTELVGRIGENLSIRRFTRIASAGAWRSTSTAVRRSACWSIWWVATRTSPRISRCTWRLPSPWRSPRTRFRRADTEGTRRRCSEGRRARQGSRHRPEDGRGFGAEVSEGSHAARSAFVKDDKQTVEQLLKSRSASVSSFVLYVVGEGIEKKTTDFAAEVAAQAQAAMQR